MRQIPSLKSIANLETLTNLIYYREQFEVKSMGNLMKKKVMEEGKAFFDVWMYEVSDEIQSLATAFGERYMLEAALALHSTTDHQAAKKIVEKCIYLHSLTLVRQQIDWYLVNEIVSVEAAAELDSVFEKAVKEFAPDLNTVVESLGLVRVPHLYGPIARDYVAFNA